MNELSLIQKFPKEKFNLLCNTDTIAAIPEIKSPVVQQVCLDTNPARGEVYIHQKAKNEWTDRKGNYHPATPDLYAITKNGLKKLADGAGIKMVSSEHVIPATCQKCVAVNQNSGKVVQCGNCKNKDVAFRVTISVPQLTGEVLMVADTNEIIVENATASMTENQKAEFMKFLPQICEAKALNGAIRTALHLKGTYTLQELQKPFVVAYLVPNLDNEDVKRAAIDNMFLSSGRLFGSTPSVQQIETKPPEGNPEQSATAGDYDRYVDGTYKEMENVPQTDSSPQNQMTEEQRNDFYCDICGISIEEKVWDYSVQHYDRPLCYKCQRKVRGNGK